MKGSIEGKKKNPAEYSRVCGLQTKINIRTISLFLTSKSQVFNLKMEEENAFLEYIFLVLLHGHFKLVDSKKLIMKTFFRLFIHTQFKL